jgi:hypothetical protein
MIEQIRDYYQRAPRNAEENLLKELWKVGRDEEKHMLAHMLVRLAQNIQS